MRETGMSTAELLLSKPGTIYFLPIDETHYYSIMEDEFVYCKPCLDTIQQQIKSGMLGTGHYLLEGVGGKYNGLQNF